ncbi:MAG: nucleotidyltransferase family protein [Bacteriovoracaceae bacterium]
MQVKACFLLAAGLGTRMEDLCKDVPKPLLPFFNSTIIESLILYLKDLGIETFYINSHYLHKVMENKLSQYNLVYEPELLGSGGAFHNLKKNFPDLQHVLSVNTDSFFIADKGSWKSFLTIDESKLKLLMMKVQKEEHLNQVHIENGLMTGITKANAVVDKSYYTYSGISLIDLSRLEFIEGESGFFDTVAKFETEDVPCHLIENYEFWDFGTKKKYQEGIKKLEVENESHLNKFLNSKEII